MSSIAAPLSAVEVDELAAGLQHATAAEILREAVDRFPGRVVLTCSWQRTSSVLVELIATNALPVRIVEVDTGLLFPETHEVRDRLIARYGVEVESLRPRRSVDEQASDHGPELWLREPDACCGLRKVEPLERALADADAWVSGLRRSSGGTRSTVQPLSLDEKRGVVKVAPLWQWTAEDVEAYCARHEIPVHALHAQGYPSIGCMPCTRAVAPGEDERAGRWAWTGKTECGLHRPA
ncbi:MAG TPA: phosphoadenylyl-sulfate reductase [Gaiellales bacterium]